MPIIWSGQISHISCRRCSIPVLIFWGIYDLILLAGPSRLANHWGYWQGSAGLFNAENPSGNVTSDELYIQILQVAIGVGVAVSLKRLAVGMFLGRQTFGTLMFMLFCLVFGGTAVHFF